MQEVMTVRAATFSDAAAMSGVVCASITELCISDHRNDPRILNKWLENKTPEYFENWLTNRNVKLFVASANSDITGVGCLTFDGEVLLNYVAPSFRYLGVSRRLLDHMEQTIFAARIETARLISTQTAHAFYRHFGWVDDGAPISVFGLTGYPMQKKLRPS